MVLSVYYCTAESTVQTPLVQLKVLVHLIKVLCCVEIKEKKKHQKTNKIMKAYNSYNDKLKQKSLTTTNYTDCFCNTVYVNDINNQPFFSIPT